MSVRSNQCRALQSCKSPCLPLGPAVLGQCHCPACTPCSGRPCDPNDPLKYFHYSDCTFVEELSEDDDDDSNCQPCQEVVGSCSHNCLKSCQQPIHMHMSCSGTPHADEWKHFNELKRQWASEKNRARQRQCKGSKKQHQPLCLSQQNQGYSSKVQRTPTKIPAADQVCAQVLGIPSQIGCTRPILDPESWRVVRVMTSAGTLPVHCCKSNTPTNIDVNFSIQYCGPSGQEPVHTQSFDGHTTSLFSSPNATNYTLRSTKAHFDVPYNEAEDLLGKISRRQTPFPYLPSIAPSYKFTDDEYLGTIEAPLSGYGMTSPLGSHNEQSLVPSNTMRSSVGMQLSNYPHSIAPEDVQSHVTSYASGAAGQSEHYATDPSSISGYYPEDSSHITHISKATHSIPGSKHLSHFSNDRHSSQGSNHLSHISDAGHFSRGSGTVRLSQSQRESSPSRASHLGRGSLLSEYSHPESINPQSRHSELYESSLSDSEDSHGLDIEETGSYIEQPIHGGSAASQSRHSSSKVSHQGSILPSQIVHSTRGSHVESLRSTPGTVYSSRSRQSEGSHSRKSLEGSIIPSQIVHSTRGSHLGSHRSTAGTVRSSRSHQSEGSHSRKSLEGSTVPSQIVHSTRGSHLGSLRSTPGTVYSSRSRQSEGSHSRKSLEGSTVPSQIVHSTRGSHLGSHRSTAGTVRSSRSHQSEGSHSRKSLEGSTVPSQLVHSTRGSHLGSHRSTAGTVRSSRSHQSEGSHSRKSLEGSTVPSQIVHSTRGSHLGSHRSTAGTEHSSRSHQSEGSHSRKSLEGSTIPSQIFHSTRGSHLGSHRSTAGTEHSSRSHQSEGSHSRKSLEGSTIPSQIFHSTGGSHLGSHRSTAGTEHSSRSHQSEGSHSRKSLEPSVFTSHDHTSQNDYGMHLESEPTRHGSLLSNNSHQSHGSVKPSSEYHSQRTYEPSIYTTVTKRTRYPSDANIDKSSGYTTHTKTTSHHPHTFVGSEPSRYTLRTKTTRHHSKGSVLDEPSTFSSHTKKSKLSRTIVDDDPSMYTSHSNAKSYHTNETYHSKPDEYRTNIVSDLTDGTAQTNVKSYMEDSRSGDLKSQKTLKSHKSKPSSEYHSQRTYEPSIYTTTKMSRFPSDENIDKSSGYTTHTKTTSHHPHTFVGSEPSRHTLRTKTTRHHSKGSVLGEPSTFSSHTKKSKLSRTIVDDDPSMYTSHSNAKSYHTNETYHSKPDEYTTNIVSDLTDGTAQTNVKSYMEDSRSEGQKSKKTMKSHKSKISKGQSLHASNRDTQAYDNIDKEREYDIGYAEVNHGLMGNNNTHIAEVDAASTHPRSSIVTAMRLAERIRSGEFD